MMAPFPHRYESSLRWPGAESDTGAVMKAGLLRPVIVGGAPPEFDGKDNWWSPEHLLLSSLNLCLMATFQDLARREKLKVSSYRSEASAKLDRTPAGLGFTEMGLRVTIAAASENLERVRRTLEKAKRLCIVARALGTPVTVELALEVAAEEKAAAFS